MDTELKEELQRIDALYQIIKEDESSTSITLNEDSRLALKKDLEKAKEQIIRSHIKKLEEKHMTPQKKCSTCGKMKKRGWAVVNVIDAAQRFAYFGKNPQVPTNNGNALEARTEFHNLTQQITSSPLLLEGTGDSGDFEEVGQRRTEERRDKSPEGNDDAGSSNQVHLRGRERRYKSPEGKDDDSGDYKEVAQRRRERRHKSPERKDDDSGDYEEVGRRRRERRSESPSSSVVIQPTLMHKQSFCGRNQRRPDSSSSSSSTGSVVSNVSDSATSDYSGSIRSHNREPEAEDDYSYKPRRSRSPEAEDDYSYRPRSRSPEGYPRRRESRHSKVVQSDHPSGKTGLFGRCKNKIGEMFHRHHHHRSSRRHQETNDMVRCKGNERRVKDKRTATVKNKRNHRPLKKLFGDLTSHLCGSKESKPSTTEKRRLERTLTGKRKVTVKKLPPNPGKSNATKRLQIEGHRRRKK
ncbi:hypothetical protein MKW94_001040 [Papaver nudicaule]|uniref:Uncharacterized protein n=1 Tax=Papaver nudicaule TaxID=74823 RepID=A0AA42AUG7_PAPNU|nr:hypothetical protein [Papaver nudicaule]MCL7040426.1 hypothetical protein [Papaver nudicaule]